MKDYEVEVMDGKYKIQLSNDGLKFRALRYGQQWRDLLGDNLILGLVFKIQELEEELATIKKEEVNK